MIETDKTLDVTGLASPRPETIAGNTLRSMEPGRVLTVLTTDRTAGEKLPLICEGLGCTVLGLEENHGIISVHIRKNTPKANDL